MYRVTSADLIYLAVTATIMVVTVYASKKIQLKGWICIGIILRVMLLWCDMFHLFPIPNLGADSEAFHRIAYHNAVFGTSSKLTNYTDFLTIIYKTTGNSRMIGQLCNVIFGLGVIVYGQRCMQLFDVDRKYLKIGTIILCLAPNLIIFSGGLLREAWCEFFITASIYHFLKWFKYGSIVQFVLSFMMALAASYMHSGSIGVVSGFMIVYILYNRRQNMFKFTFRSIFAVGVVLGFSIFFLNNMDTFGGKMSGMDGENTEEVMVSHYSGQQGGGSDYLVGLPVNSMAGALLFSPLKMLYFAISPVPWEWRGFQDILAFAIDSIIYLILCIGIIKKNRRCNSKLRAGLIISLISVVFIFGIGVTNAGTAMRHRAKLLPLFVIAYCISKTPLMKQHSNENNIHYYPCI